ncbi:N-formylglutamate amidohydrolase [Xanthomonas prunicola]|uniref:N-formylglutamate amidohydrolase n=1 Tax=Xanthomonas prunicola TaxID=2053930 RepID=A0A9Q9MTK9_9XANT|nr:N-formylglutamate amidohydrolase [Xanthomonas prunicola]USJ01644.1 N-formylglutamate amidohydrolase [Xanthomonas prunicola]UXA50128.1 N-formylglutamate amidohydrolase [Xanthomonas prunicola]UXA52144.1 N-formylglutamate amidohydrolase [Xanthomonas prunicola]UXA58433.1 N-formylglutamate amidohydrolase [Xanthomonas prunicola]UXA60578.1 N-formylglutamate amidohydrolase [Xanthomonas prunicola]
MALRVAEDAIEPLLGADDPAPFTVHNPQAASPWLLIADHAGQRVPARLANLGLPQFELDRHIGWDIGIAQVTRLLAEALDAFAIAQTYSRLVIDCNRPDGAASRIPDISDGTSIPANLALTGADRQQRIDAIFAPYQARIAAELDARAQRAQPTLLVSMHSFTPVMAGNARPWHAGVLYHRDTRLAHRLLDALRAEPELVVGDNQPYAVSDATDYAIPVHGEGRGLLHVELEIRQDLIAEAAGQQAWAARLARILPPLAEVLLAP